MAHRAIGAVSPLVRVDTEQDRLLGIILWAHRACGSGSPPVWGNGNNNCAQYLAPENGNDIKSDVNLGPVGRAKPKFTTTEAGIEIDSLGVDYAQCDEIPVTKMIPVLDTDEH